jgi:hypothetical protein
MTSRLHLTIKVSEWLIMNISDQKHRIRIYQFSSSMREVTTWMTQWIRVWNTFLLTPRLSIKIKNMLSVWTKSFNCIMNLAKPYLVTSQPTVTHSLRKRATAHKVATHARGCSLISLYNKITSNSAAPSIPSLVWCITEIA